ncbi:hypothetical protein [Polyangium sp. y55x31]|uniref:hypothetical protein n=1 Tax=Polyangium sp. y55x31 TaxID=3042688 RepID=UPI002482D944|nr:hypothetical protein [Polyangium sp. y55x31]MDI1482789.1 hypothetical protein [Polyangium sp. y55x31]
MSKPRAFLPLVFALSALLAGCIGENEDVVFVEPSIVAPTADVEGGVLGATVTGSFTLKLVLGPRASGPSSVQLGTLAITDAPNQQSVVSGLSLISPKPFPVTVQPDSEVTLDFFFDLGDKTISDETKNALCLPAGVRIAGTLQDSLDVGATTVASDVFKPTGCM